MNFKNLAIVCALLCFSLAAIWLFAPGILLNMWGVDFSYSVGLVGRRSAALYVGIGVMFFYARNSEHSLARSAIISGIVVAFLALAALGTFELATVHATPGILSAILVEVAFALAFLRVARARR
jgi:hypothetical protein